MEGCEVPLRGKPANLDPQSSAELSMAYLSVHQVQKKEEKPSIKSILSIVSTPVAHELHTVFLLNNTGRATQF